MKKIVAILIGALFINSFAFAQTDKEKALKPRVEQKLADLLYAQSHYYSASEYYKEVIRSKPEWRYPRYWLAMSTLKANDYENAVKYFKSFDEQRLPDKKKKIKRIEKENKEVYGLSDYYYGVALKHVGQYDDAIKRFEKFKSTYELKDKDEWSKKTLNEIKGAQWAIANPGTKKVKVKSLGDLINTGYEDAGPMPVNDSTMYYTSLQENDLIFVNNRKDIPPYRLYQSTKVDGKWQKGKELPSVFQDKKFGTTNAALSEDGNRLYFCKCYNNEIDEIICNMFLSEKTKGGKWGEAVKLNESINDPKYTSTQPTVRSSGDNMEIVYFVSDREGGIGGMDIWYFIRTARGDFKGPKLLKGGINTVGDELTPFYDNSNEKFYFSSNGHPSIGGFDIFASTENEELGWTEPENVGIPINSTADDLYYRRENGKTSGYLVSNRDGTTKIDNKYRGDDIYSFEDFKYGLEGFVFKDEGKGEETIENAIVRLYKLDENGNDVMVEELTNVNEQYFFKLKPDQDYKVEVVKPGYSSSYEYITTKNIPYEDTLNQNLLVNKTNVIALGSLYADSDTLKKNKLDDAILVLKAVNPDGSKTTLTTKKMPAGTFDYNFDLEIGKKYEIDVTKDGYFKGVIPINTAGAKSDKIQADGILSKIEVGKSYELENILYDFGKATLRSESKVVLDDLVTILRDNPSIIIELASHTDAIGSDEANLKLSQARAQSCVDYLIEKGISKSRLSAKGYGEAKPIAPNEKPDGSDNPEGRQKNRRTEFSVIDSF